MSSSITRTRGNGGLEKIVINHPAAEGEIYLYGAYVTHWKPAGAEPVLWMSPQAIFKEGTPIRGGVPICLPWFGPHPASKEAPSHGLVRTRNWDLVNVTEDANGVTVKLRLDIPADLSPYWTHAFTAEFTVHFGKTFTMTLAVTNDSGTAFQFNEALHTYFRVRDVRETSVGGLAGTTFIDKKNGYTRHREEREGIVMTEETDRVYVDTTATCVVQDQHLGRRIFVEKTGSKSTVIWNPFPEKAKVQPDIGEANWPGFICVESANCADDTVTVAAGATHEISVHLRLEPIENA
ncbi:MAG: D-hexose-6-phosphate mutarotase [Phycisphaerales bacterium]|nr:D-hexose-6-phosphate mutarotase [Phycisphaerales bacterium]